MVGTRIIIQFWITTYVLFGRNIFGIYVTTIHMKKVQMRAKFKPINVG